MAKKYMVKRNGVTLWPNMEPPGTSTEPLRKDRKFSIPSFSRKFVAMALTEKEELFCQGYLIDFNGARAAREAGYSVDTAREIACQNLAKIHIRARIQELRAEMGKAFNVTRERIAQEYSRLAFFDIRNVYDSDGELIPVTDLTDDAAAAIAGIEVLNEWDKDIAGRPVITGQLKKIKIADKRAALDSLVKLMGYAEPDKMMVSGMKFNVTDKDE